MKASVSVILPVFNGAQFLEQALQSILRQTFSNYELLVIDDGSTDNSADIIRSFNRVNYIYQENQGVTHARNRGILASSGTFLAFLDQDDRWRKNALQTHVEFHASHPEISYTLAHQVCFIDSSFTTPSWFGLQKLGDPHVGYLPGTLMVKRPLFNELGMFDTQYPISSDADWFARAKDSGIAMRILDNVLLERRIHAGNQSAQAERIHSELFHLLRASIRRKRAQ